MKLMTMHLWLALALAACDPTDPPVLQSRAALQAADGGVRPSGVADCYTAASSDAPALRTFWEAMLEGRVAQRDLAIQQLTAAAAAQPDEERFALHLALAHLWRLAEPQGLWDAVLALDSAQVAERELERALAICPSDARILGWLGPLQMRVGEMLGDAALREQGARRLEMGIERYPSFVTFTNVIAYAGAALGSADFQRALDAARYYLEAGTAEGVDCAAAGDPACLNTPHNIEGTALFLGDVFVKAQDPAARAHCLQVGFQLGGPGQLELPKRIG